MGHRGDIDAPQAEKDTRVYSSRGCSGWEAYYTLLTGCSTEFARSVFCEGCGRTIAGTLAKKADRSIGVGTHAIAPSEAVRRCPFLASFLRKHRDGVGVPAEECGSNPGSVAHV